VSRMQCTVGCLLPTGDYQGDSNLCLSVLDTAAQNIFGYRWPQAKRADRVFDPPVLAFLKRGITYSSLVSSVLLLLVPAPIVLMTASGTTSLARRRGLPSLVVPAAASKGTSGPIAITGMSAMLAV